jgi:post-segregation antitoxin (ccd killing protein)
VRELRPDAPPPLSEAIARALRKDREERWPTAREMLAAVAG